jgi:hypothetical protein
MAVTKEMISMPFLETGLVFMIPPEMCGGIASTSGDL